MITDKTKRKVALFLSEFCTKVNVGSGGNASFPSSTDLDVPLLHTRESTTNIISSDTTVDFKVSINSSKLVGNTLREIGIFSETMPADDKFDELRAGSSIGTVDTTMMSRLVFDAIGPIQENETLNFIYTLEVE